MRDYLGVDWADQTHAVWVMEERGTKITARAVPHTAEGLNGEGWATCPSPIPCPARPDGRPWSFGGRLETLETAYETGVSASSGCRRCPVARDLGGHGRRPEEQRTVAGWWREIGRV